MLYKVLIFRIQGAALIFPRCRVWGLGLGMMMFWNPAPRPSIHPPSTSWVPASFAVGQPQQATKLYAQSVLNKGPQSSKLHVAGQRRSRETSLRSCKPTVQGMVFLVPGVGTLPQLHDMVAEDEQEPRLSWAPQFQRVAVLRDRIPRIGCYDCILYGVRTLKPEPWSLQFIPYPCLLDLVRDIEWVYIPAVM